MAKKGTFERIREISPYAFGFFGVMLVLFFTIGDPTVVDGLFSTGLNPQTAPIVTVNGEDIRYIDYENKVREQIEQQRLSQQDPGKEIDETQIRQQVWNQMIDEVLMRQQAEEAGIIVTDEEIADIMIENPPDYLKKGFIDSAGTFQKGMYLDIVTNPENIANYIEGDQAKILDAIQTFRNDLIVIENYLRNQTIRENLTVAVNAAGSILSPAYAREKYLSENSTADVSFIAIKISENKDTTIEVSDSEIEEYYNEHRKYYKQKPQRKIKYVSFPIVPSADDSTRAQKKTRRVMEALRQGATLAERDSIFDHELDKLGGTTSDFTLVKDLDKMKSAYLIGAQTREVIGPVRLGDGNYFFRVDERREGESVVVKASHILINSNDNKDSAKAEADKIYKRAKKGEDFAILAMQYSKDPGSGKRGGDLGYFGKGQMVKPFEEAAFGAEIGEITKPVESRFGFHIIKVVDKRSDEIIFSEIVIKPTLTAASRSAIYRQAHSFKKQVEEDGVNFDTLAAMLDMVPVETALFEKKRPVLGSQYITDVVFDSEVGDVLEPVDVKRYGVIVAQVTDIRNAGIVPLEDKAEEIKRKLVSLKKLELIKPKIESIYNRIKSGTDLIAAGATNPDISVKTADDIKPVGSVPGLGKDEAFAYNAFTLPIGKISEPIKGELGYYIIQVREREIPSEDKIKDEMPDYISKLEQNIKSSTFFQWYNNIKEEAQVEDFRMNFYKEY